MIARADSALEYSRSKNPRSVVAILLLIPIIIVIVTMIDSPLLLTVMIGSPFIFVPIMVALQRVGITNKPLIILLWSLSATGLFIPYAIYSEPFTQVDKPWLLFFSILISIIVILCLLYANRTRIPSYEEKKSRFAIQLMFILVFFSLYFLSLLVAINWSLDGSIPATHRAVIVGKSIDDQRMGTRYIITAEELDHTQFDVAVSSLNYRSLTEGEAICVRIHRGALRAVWLDASACD